MKRFKQFLNGIIVGSLIFGLGLIVEMKYTNHIKEENKKLYSLLEEALDKNENMKHFNEDNMEILNIEEDVIYIQIDSEVYKVRYKKEDFKKIEY